MIYLVRHGQSTTNALGLLVGRSDPELTDHGRHQARALHGWLDGVEQVITSPLRRARETAALAVPTLEAEVEHAFIEVDYGDLDGTPLTNVTEEQWRAFESDHTHPMGNGESLHAVDQRVHTRLNELAEDEGSLLHDADRHLLIVSHVSPIKSALTWAMGVHGSVAWRMRIDNGGVSVIGSRRGTATLVRTNVVPPLPQR